MAGSSIADNLAQVRESIAQAAQRAGRKPESVRLIAVSKAKPAEAVAEALRAGQTSFGENYVQEAVAKIEAVSAMSGLPKADWHFIGGLQSNKVKQVVGHFALIHSADRARLFEEIAKSASAASVVQDILLEVHIGGEATKQGLPQAEAPALIKRIQELPSLRLRGVMSLPPLTDDERIGRGYFAELRELFERWKKNEMNAETARGFTELSMGTSADYEWAIAEGATMVRIGTAIFGARNVRTARGRTL